MACRKAASAVQLTILPVSILGMLFLPAPIQAQSVDAVSPESIERIRAALSQPPPVLRVPAPSTETLTFHVEVTAPLSLLEPIDDKPFDPTFGLPSIQELVGRGRQPLRRTVDDVDASHGVNAVLILEGHANGEVGDAISIEITLGGATAATGTLATSV